MAFGQIPDNKMPISHQTEWLLSDLLQDKTDGVHIKGKPQLVSSPYGEAVSFNGDGDAIFVDKMPLESMEEFTVEMIFAPDKSTIFEQRVLHIGEISKDRILLEIRAKNENWYFDGYVTSGKNKKALIDEKLIHPLGKWYHVALVVGKSAMSTFVNGELELTEPFDFKPLESGQCSIGVRQNEVSWFAGEIYKIRITPKQLNREDFLAF